MPSFSVVVPTRGDRDLTSFHQALKSQSLPLHEVIVVPDPEGKGPSWARNRGIEKASGELIGFLDDDCLPPPHWAASMAEAIESHGAVGAGGNYQEADPFLAQRRSRVSHIPPDLRVDEGLVGQGGNMVFTRSWLEKLQQWDGHVFDEDFIISQDWELTWRTRLHGGSLVYVPVHVQHTKQVSTLSYLKLQFGRGLGSTMLYLAQNSAPSNQTPHRSLLWGEAGNKRRPRWLKALWLKLVGPFPQGHFESPRFFLRFWLGEKLEGLGFVYFFTIHKLTGRYGVRDYSEINSSKPGSPTLPNRVVS